jgi:16S rRNA (adenine1518-N6/adenine1519-N6)-dimethyltransferase
MGQNYLHDPQVISKIIGLLMKEGEQILNWIEIGPGEGALTLPVCERLKNSQHSIQLIERDRELCHLWNSKLPFFPLSGVMEADAARVSWAELLTQPTFVYSNLPYSAGTAILEALSRHPGRISSMVLMFQKEVGDRLCATPGSKAWGSLSLFIQNAWEVLPAFTVSPSAFRPAPKIWSQVLVLRPRQTPLITGDYDRLTQLLKSLFQHRRKMLRASLKGHPKILEALSHSGISDTLRAEALTFEQWVRLYHEWCSVTPIGANFH